MSNENSWRDSSNPADGSNNLRDVLVWVGAMSEWVSECCSAPEIDQSMDMGICTDCKEHCDYIDLDDLDPTPWCAWCHAKEASQCECGPFAENH